MDRIIDDDAGSPDSLGILSLTEALAGSQRRRRQNRWLLIAMLVTVGVLASLSIYVAQLNQIRALQAKAYATCLNRTEQMKAELILLHAISDSATNDSVRSAADLALDTFPPLPDCLAYR